MMFFSNVRFCGCGFYYTEHYKGKKTSINKKTSLYYKALHKRKKMIFDVASFFDVVPLARLELARRKAPDFESGVSTNSTTEANTKYRSVLRYFKLLSRYYRK